MARFANGRIPRNRLIKIGSGTDVNGYWEHQISPSTLRKWQIALDYARRKWGKVMRISTGWNCYRPIAIQADARRRAEANGEPNSAARAGWSSHGGTWVSQRHTRGRWVDAMAIDVVPQELTWAQVDEAMRHAGFLVGAITKDIAGMDEPWHYIDLDPWAAVPAGGNTTPAESKTPDEGEEEDEDMAMKGATIKLNGGKNRFILFNEVSGFYVEHSGVDGAYNNSIAQKWHTDSWPTITEAHGVVLKRALDAVRRTALTGSVSVDLSDA